MSGPKPVDGLCYECPHFRERGGLDDGAFCAYLSAELEYYDGWLALCEDGVEPAFLREQQETYKRIEAEEAALNRASTPREAQDEHHP